MPELPEVEALRDFLTDRLRGRSVSRVLPLAVSVLKTYDPPLSALEGGTCAGVARHGKFLDLEVGDLHLVLHLARAGWLRWQDQLPTAPPRPGKGPLALRLWLTASKDADPAVGTAGFDLTEAGTQKRLAVYLVREVTEVPGVARLGPDPLADGFTLAVFRGLLTGQQHRVKGVLRDQRVIAGIGNAYSDEILHAARMSPYLLAGSLSEEQTATLYEALRTTLRDAVERSRGFAAGSLKARKRGGMRVHGRTGEPCPVCGDTVREVSFSDSSLQYCPTCQTGGKPLADRRMSRLLR
ncbi:Fpg/Nei family DNA glycosylase [Streptomyces oceani]|uniref:DNA lyase n=1 Tax=Streptomyces oceani TaxID=1075402 RepID=A0A1E7KJE3_9ACTN|nr:DNA-formamidopyrimidine glycosylase family protein [Streptomyces oceani]OEV04079.1 DNA lyase [Streptomyces oceani]